jgi:hypothetical protein
MKLQSFKAEATRYIIDVGLETSEVLGIEEYVGFFRLRFWSNGQIAV